MTMSFRCLKDKLKNDLHVRESVRSLFILFYFASPSRRRDECVTHRPHRTHRRLRVQL
jgi:hypothetical protein